MSLDTRKLVGKSLRHILFLLLVFVNAHAVTAYSQTYKWTRAPTLQLTKLNSVSKGTRLYRVWQTVSRYRNSFGFIDNTGKLVIDFKRLPTTTRYVGEFHEGLAVIHLERQESETTIKGYIDRTGKIVIGPRFDYARDFSEGLAYVETKNFRGFIDDQGKTVINLNRLAVAFGTSIQKIGARDFHEGRAAVGTGRWPVYQQSFDDSTTWEGRWGYINRAGRLVVEPIYLFADDFSEGRAGVVINGARNRYEAKYGFVDLDGRLVIREQFSPRPGGPHYFGIGGTATFHEGLACVKTLDGFYGYIDRTGLFIIPPKLARASDFSDGLAWAVGLDLERKVFSTIGFLDKTGRWVLTEHKGQKFAENLPLRFSEGLAAVPTFDSINSESKWGYMDHNGGEVIKASHLSSADPFEDGIARVSIYDASNGEMYGYIDKRGHFIWKSR